MIAMFGLTNGGVPMKWTNLTEQQYTRLCECRSLKKDIIHIAKAYMIEKDYDAEQALETTLEHLGANSQFFDLSEDEWNDMVNELSRGCRV